MQILHRPLLYYCVDHWLFQTSKNYFKVLGNQPLKLPTILSSCIMPLLYPLESDCVWGAEGMRQSIKTSQLKLIMGAGYSQ